MFSITVCMNYMYIYTRYIIHVDHTCIYKCMSYMYIYGYTQLQVDMLRIHVDHMSTHVYVPP